MKTDVTHMHICMYNVVCMYMYVSTQMYVIHIHVLMSNVHVHSSCRAAWALQLICWKYSDLCTSVM